MTDAAILQRLTDKIVKAVPELGQPCDALHHSETLCAACSSGNTRPITLEYVLRAYKNQRGFAWLEEAFPVTMLTDWKLGEPLSKQSPECLAFLDSLLQ